MSHTPTEEREHDLNNFKEAMLAAAYEKHGLDIKAPRKVDRLEDSFTFEAEGLVILWYDTPDNSTHTLYGTFCQKDKNASSIF